MLCRIHTCFVEHGEVLQAAVAREIVERRWRPDASVAAFGSTSRFPRCATSILASALSGIIHPRSFGAGVPHGHQLPLFPLA